MTGVTLKVALSHSLMAIDVSSSVRIITSLFVIPCVAEVMYNLIRKTRRVSIHERPIMDDVRMMKGALLCARVIWNSLPVSH